MREGESFISLETAVVKRERERVSFPWKFLCWTEEKRGRGTKHTQVQTYCDLEDKEKHKKTVCFKFRFDLCFLVFFLYIKMGLRVLEDFSSPVVRDLRIVLLGKTGSGKSETGNTILGRKVFETKDISLSSVTIHCKKETGHFDQRTVSVIDTPGVFDTSMTEVQFKSEIENCIMLSLPGPHIFLLVIRLDTRFTDEEKKAVKWIKDNFGEEASKYTMVLFTRGDALRGKPVDDYISKSPELKEVISDCRAGYIVFDNTRTEDNTQVADLLKKIDKVVQLHGNHYTSTIYEEVQKKRKWNEWWSKCGDTVNAASNYLFVAAAVAAAPVAGAAVAAEEVAAASLRSAFMLAGAGAAKVIGGWIKPKTKDN